MSFIKSFFACLCAILVSALIITLLLLGIGAAMIYSSSSKGTITSNSVLYIPLEGSMEERGQNDIYAKLLSNADVTPSLESILSSIKVAKTDDRIKGIYLKPGVLSCGYASLEEIRQALQDFKSSGKFIYVYSGTYTQGAYYVSSVADSIFINPQGVLDFRGVASSSMFYKHLLDTLGVDMQVIKVGTYKSFTEQYSNDSMSAPNREQTEHLVHGLWNTMLKEISLSRSISEDSLDMIANQMMAFQMPQVALNYRMVDGIRYADEVKSLLMSKLSLKEDDKIPFVSVVDYFDSQELEKTAAAVSPKKVAVLYMVGEIDNGNKDGISSSEMISQLNKLRSDSTIKAVVIRVNSPGGSAYGAEQIWRGVKLLQEKKPVVVSMGDYAASGGYYLSTGANYIYADSKTITGSIGVFGVIPNVSKLMDKIGVKHEVVKTNPYADLLSNFTRPLSEEETTLLQSHVADVYDTFLSRCSEGRNMEKSEVEKIAEGRVWSGVDALNIGLVDKLGTLKDAVSYAAKLAELGDGYAVVSYPELKSPLEQLSELPHIGYEKMFHSEVLSREMEILNKLERLDFHQAIMPYSVFVK